MARKKITQVTAEDIESIIGNSVQSAKNRLVGSATEQKKMFVRPIANTDGSPSVAKLVQRLAQEAEESLQQLENDVEDLEDSLATPPPADSIPLSGVFFEYDRETETLNIVGEKGVSEEDVASIIEDETGAKFTELETDMETLSANKQDTLVFADAYNADTNKVATENTVKREVAAIVAEAPDEFNTLKEIAAWIAEHPDDIGAINALIQENKQAIRLNAELITNNTKALNAQSTKINANEVGINDLKALQERLSVSMDKKVEKTTTANQLYGTDADGNPALYPTDSVGTSVFVDGQKVKEFNADEKFDKIGGVIGGDVSIQGNLSVSGTTTTKDTETLQVKDNVIVANADGVSLVDDSGFAIKTNTTDAYGIMYDPIGDGVKIGLGGFTEDGKFVYNEGEAQFLATRADNITDGNLPQWDNDKKQFVDSGENIGNFMKFTDEPSTTKAGPVKVSTLNYGLEYVSSQRAFRIKPMTQIKLDGRGNYSYEAVTLAWADRVVKAVMTSPSVQMTDLEQQQACDWIGALTPYSLLKSADIYGDVEIKIGDEKADPTIFDGDVTRYGFAEGTEVIQVNVEAATDVEDKRLVMDLNVAAKSFTIDFALEYELLGNIYIWGTGTTGERFLVGTILPEGTNFPNKQALVYIRDSEGTNVRFQALEAYKKYTLSISFSPGYMTKIHIGCDDYDEESGGNILYFAKATETFEATIASDRLSSMVVYGLTTNKYELTPAQKSNACKWLGVTDLINDLIARIEVLENK